MGHGTHWTLDEQFETALGMVRWTRLGDPGAEPLVLVHGTPFSSFIWRDIAPALAVSRSVYVFDMPGYGSSAMSEGQAAFYRQLDRRRSDPGYIDRIRPRYPAIDVPALVCWGADDAWVPAARGRELAQLVPGAELRVVGGAGHLLPEDCPAELTAALLAFLPAS